MWTTKRAGHRSWAVLSKHLASFTGEELKTAFSNLPQMQGLGSCVLYLCDWQVMLTFPASCPQPNLLPQCLSTTSNTGLSWGTSSLQETLEFSSGHTDKGLPTPPGPRQGRIQCVYHIPTWDLYLTQQEGPWQKHRSPEHHYMPPPATERHSSILSWRNRSHQTHLQHPDFALLFITCPVL